MRATLWISILALLSLSFVSCSSSGGESSPTEPAPEVTSLDPSANDPSVPLDATIAATFDQTMEAASSDSFVVFGSQTGRLSAGTYSGDGIETLEFTPGQDFQPGEIVEVILTDFLTSTEGVSPESYVYYFQAATSGGTGDFSVNSTVSSQFGASALAVPLIALMYRYSNDFSYLFFVLAAMAAAMFGAALFMPAQAAKPARA